MSESTLDLDVDVDVVVVGLGPVGQALSLLLGRKGHRVLAVERWPDVFPLPRAGHVDHEVMRILQALSVAKQIDDDSAKLSGYEFRDANDQIIATMDWGHQGISGWYSDYSLFQPYLERLIQDQVLQQTSVEIRRSWQVEAIEQDASSAMVTMRHGRAEEGVFHSDQQPDQVTTRYVVGCDGANSVVRDSAGIKYQDLGFCADWLVVFVEPFDESLREGMPDVAQLLNPDRPSTVFRASGKRFCRWEFMLMPGETPESMSTPEMAWHLIADWGLAPENSRLIRNTVFRFQSKVARNWRDGRLFLAGDAAHLMPPFLGQGMCSGLRDAKCLAWKLDLVLRGDAGEALLDSYELERSPHSNAVVRASLELGKIIGTTDPEAASVRNEALRSGAISPPGALPPLSDGVLRRNPDGDPLAPAGLLSAQPIVVRGATRALLDEFTGDGWVITAMGFDPREALAPELLAVLDHLGAALVQIERSPAGADVLVDETGAYAAWLEQIGVHGVVVRPDFYVFAGFNDPEDLSLAVADLARQLHVLEAAGATVALAPTEWPDGRLR